MCQIKRTFTILGYLNGAGSLQGVESPRLERWVKKGLGASGSPAAGAEKLEEELVGHVGLVPMSWVPQDFRVASALGLALWGAATRSYGRKIQPLAWFTPALLFCMVSGRSAIAVWQKHECPALTWQQCECSLGLKATRDRAAELPASSVWKTHCQGERGPRPFTCF